MIDGAVSRFARYFRWSKSGTSRRRHARGGDVEVGSDHNHTIAGLAVGRDNDNGSARFSEWRERARASPIHEAFGVNFETRRDRRAESLHAAPTARFPQGRG